jgi:hypothetical protein
MRLLFLRNPNTVYGCRLQVCQNIVNPHTSPDVATIGCMRGTGFQSSASSFRLTVAVLMLDIETEWVLSASLTKFQQLEEMFEAADTRPFSARDVSLWLPQQPPWDAADYHAHTHQNAYRQD